MSRIKTEALANAQKKYYGKLKDIKIRIVAPDEEYNIPDYKADIAERAKSKEMSVNTYILDLIEKDLKEAKNDPTYKIYKGLNEVPEKK